jgi:hypothetical protein
VSTLARTRTTTEPNARSQRGAALLLLLGGVTFFVAGGIHPKGASQGTKVAQLYEMLIDPLWYPAHVVFLVAMGCFAAGIVGLRRRPDIDVRTARVVGPASWIAVVGLVGMVFHLFAATAASGIADGDATLLYNVHVLNETVINPLWGLSIAALALVGGLTRTVGNRLTLVIGVVGGVAPYPAPRPSGRSGGIA